MKTNAVPSQELFIMALVFLHLLLLTKQLKVLQTQQALQTVAARAAARGVRFSSALEANVALLVDVSPDSTSGCHGDLNWSIQKDLRFHQKKLSQNCHHGEVN